MEKFKAWWASLATREQQLVAAAAVVIVIGIFYWGILKPLNSSLDEQKNKLSKQQQLLSWMKDKGEIIVDASRDRTRSIAGAKQSLNQVINATARSKEIKLTRVQPKDDEIDVWIESVEFDQLLSWFELLQNRYGVSVKNVELTRNDEKGLVNVRRLQLARK